ncbi:MAG: helix-turn-helix transcriptional regulator [Bacteroidia bacterium]|nr:helix-turn-helix transcriptional regulator [Bacteroidia bacterium]
MKLDFYKPKNEILQKYIEGYYFISEDKNSGPVTYYTFPNNFSILSINQNAEVEFENNKIIISGTAKENITADLVTRYTEPIEVFYERSVNEITIYFKPLGIDHFLGNTGIPKQNKMEDFNPFPDFKEAMQEIFRTAYREQQIELLEGYWLSKFIKKDTAVIEQIVSDIEADLKMEEIAEKHNLSRRYINKLFLKKVGKTPSEYRKIYRFRTALNEAKKAKNLTQLSHNSLFYDQAHFIKDFKKLTNINPGFFFKNVDTEKGNVWLFI